MNPSSENKLQAGFAVSSRNFKKAADRNRIKRLMREAYRLQKNKLADLLKEKEKNLSLFFVYTGKELPLYNLISEKIEAALNRLIKLNNGNT